MKVDQNRLLILDHNFRRQNKVDQNAFTMQLLHMIWKPANPFRDQKIRSYVVVKNKFWKTWLLFHFVQIDSKWEEEITQEDHHSCFEENWEKILKFFKILEIPRKAFFIFFLLNPSKLNHELCNGLFSFFQKRVARLDSRAGPFYWKTHPIVNFRILRHDTGPINGKLIQNKELKFWKTEILGNFLDEFSRICQ